MTSARMRTPAGPDGTSGRALPFGNLKPQTYENLFAVTWSALAVNLLLAVINAPLVVALAVVAEPFRSWPFFLLLSLPLGPSMAAVFSCLERFRTEHRVSPLRDLLAGLRRFGGRALGIWVAGLAAGAVLLVDLIVLQQTPYSGLITPPLVVLMLLTVVTVVAMLWASVAYPRAPFGTLLRVGLVVAVRRWPLTLFSLLVLAVLAAGIAMAPPVGLLVGPALALYIVDNNLRQAFLRTLEPDRVADLPYQPLPR